MRLLVATVLLCTGCLSALYRPQPTPPLTGDTCADYCAVVEACEPAHAYETCQDDCTELLRDSEALRVSGIDVRCWAASTDCDAAKACDE